jgi:enoyl-CoA hydratase
MEDVKTWKDGKAGLIRLTRPQALNALSHAMSLAIEEAFDAWRDDDDVQIVIIDAEGEKAFCSGGDITGIYHLAKAGQLQPPRDFWREEYRLNAKIAEYAKPVVSFLNGFVMGGGVGIGCHGSHRIVGESSKLAMPECGIGLIPDVGGSLILAHAPGRLGEYLGLTGERMTAADAIFAGFADVFVPETSWGELKAKLAETGDVSLVDSAAADPGEGILAGRLAAIDRVFSGPNLTAILQRLEKEPEDWAQKALTAINRGSPISLAATLEIVRTARGFSTVREATRLEFRFTWRSHQLGDFVEGIRAQLIDRDRNPQWQHDSPDGAPPAVIAEMLSSLGENELDAG